MIIFMFILSVLILYPIVRFTINHLVSIGEDNKMTLFVLTDEESKAIYFTAKDPQLLEDYKVKFEIRGDHLKIIKLVEE